MCGPVLARQASNIARATMPDTSAARTRNAASSVASVTHREARHAAMAAGLTSAPPPRPRCPRRACGAPARSHRRNVGTLTPSATADSRSGKAKVAGSAFTVPQPACSWAIGTLALEEPCGCDHRRDLFNPRTRQTAGAHAMSLRVANHQNDKSKSSSSRKLTLPMASGRSGRSGRPAPSRSAPSTPSASFGEGGR